MIKSRLKIAIVAVGYITAFFVYAKFMDTIMHGVIAGSAGAAASVVPGVIEKNIFKLAKLTFLDYAAVLTVGHEANDLPHWLIAVIGHVVFGAALGVAFAYVIKETGHESVVFKGAGFGAFVWLITLALGSFYKIPHFKVTQPSDCFFILIDAIIFGLVTAFVYQRLLRNIKNSR